MNINNIRSQFPIFSKKINNKPLVYLDSSNSSQKPISVLNSLDNFYKNEFSNIGRSIHSLAVNATNKFEDTRVNVKNFINANSKDEIIFTKNATESINLVATTFGQQNIKKGDEILITELEIYADDVKCSHGSTCSQLDESAIFYLMSRGIDLSSAKKMLIKGFLFDALETITCGKIKELFSKRLEDKINEYK